MGDDAPGNLEDATTLELMEELASRFDAVVLVWECDEPRGDRVGFNLCWRGSTITVRGLLDFAKIRLDAQVARVINEQGDRPSDSLRGFDR